MLGTSDDVGVAIPALTFEPVAHEYFLPSGERVPSVTEILRDTGISENFDQLALMNRSLRADIEFARALGTAVHHDCHAADDNALVWDSMDERVVPFVTAWLRFRADHKLAPVARERRVYHPVYGYAGTLDGVFARRPGGPFTLVDIKTGSVEASACRYQTAAYLAAYTYAQEREVREASATTPLLAGMDRMAVQLTPLSNPPYKVTPYPRKDQRRDFEEFKAFLVTYRAQYARRKRAVA